MEELLRKNLLALFGAYGVATGMKPTAIGRHALNDTTVFSRLTAAEIGFGVRTYDKLAQYFSDHWPTDLDWPEEIARPAPSKHPEAAE